MRIYYELKLFEVNSDKAYFPLNVFNAMPIIIAPNVIKEKVLALL